MGTPGFRLFTYVVSHPTTIGKNVIIGDSAFFSSSLEELTVGSGSEIGKEAFAYSSDLKTKNIDSDVKSCDDSFYYAGGELEIYLKEQ